MVGSLRLSGVVLRHGTRRGGGVRVSPCPFFPPGRGMERTAFSCRRIRAKCGHKGCEALEYRPVLETGWKRRSREAGIHAGLVCHGAEAMAFREGPCGIPRGPDELSCPGSYRRGKNDGNVYRSQHVRHLCGTITRREVENRRQGRGGHSPRDGSSSNVGSARSCSGRMEASDRGRGPVTAPAGLALWFERRGCLVIDFLMASDTMFSLRMSPRLFPSHRDSGRNRGSGRTRVSKDTCCRRNGGS